MAVLSARFAVLACLCAVLPLTPPVEAAHLYGSHSMKHTSSPYSPQRTHNPSLFGGSTTAHRHDDKNHGHRVQDHRASELPPLLRRYRVHDHKRVHNHHGQDPYDHAHDKVPRSAFARSRYRREPGTHSRRSSVYVPGEHGNTYLVSRTPPRNWGHGSAGTDKQSSHAYNRRQVDESNLALGRVDIMGAASGSAQRLASLTVDSTPIDWSSGQSSAKAFPLNASTTNQTQFIMMPTDESNAGGSLNKHVTLATEVFDASSAEMVMYCATYDSDPGAASPLLMTPCTGAAQSVSSADDAADPCAGDENDASSSNPHQSQIFSYDPSSGMIEPISATESADNSTPCAGTKVRRDAGNSTTGGSARPSSTSTSTAPTASASQQARNVTLVYVAGALEVPAPSPSSSITTATASASIGQAATFTTTITTTVVATVTASGSSTRTATPARAAASVSTPLTPSPSTTIPAPSVSTTTTRSPLSLSSSTASAVVTLTKPVPANADESLEVEIVGVTPSTSATTTIAAAATTTTTSHSSGSVSPTLDAEAVASLVANQMAHQRRAVVIAGASIAQ